MLSAGLASFRPCWVQNLKGHCTGTDLSAPQHIRLQSKWIPSAFRELAPQNRLAEKYI